MHVAELAERLSSVTITAQAWGTWSETDAMASCQGKSEILFAP